MTPLAPPLYQWSIVDEASWLKVCDILHDAVFDLSTLTYDEACGTLRTVFKREFLEDEKWVTSRRIFLFLFQHRFPLIESELLLSNIKSIDIRDRSKIGTYYFNEIKKLNNGYRFVFCENLRIDLKFRDEPCGDLIDRRMTGEYVNFYTFGKGFISKG